MGGGTLSRKQERDGRGLEHRAEIEVVAEGTRADMIEALRGQEHRRRRQCDDRNAPAVADRLGAEGGARHGVEHADQIGRHRQWLAVAPGDDPFVLERDLDLGAAVLVEPIDDGAAAQIALGRAPGDIDDLAAEKQLALRLVEDRGDRVLVPALRRGDAAADADRLARIFADKGETVSRIGRIGPRPAGQPGCVIPALGSAAWPA